MKLGIYADGSAKNMVVFAELFDGIDKWDSRYMMKKTDEVKNEMDYYEKVWKGGDVNVHKFEFNIFPNVNGVLMRNSRYFWQDSDQLEIDYSFKYHGKAVFQDYMDF